MTDLDRLDRIRREYTDQYVVVDATRPELARFGGFVGQVRTVNMNGRALVEFLDFYRNAGWHDIELDYLKVVDKPAQEKADAPIAAKPAAKPTLPPSASKSVDKRPSPLEMARQQGPAKGKRAKPAATGSGKKSVAEILAAARAQKKGDEAGTEEVESTAGAVPPSTASETAKAKRPTDGKKGKMSVAEILAAARAEKKADAPQDTESDA